MKITTTTTTSTPRIHHITNHNTTIIEDKVESVGSGRRPSVGSNPTTCRLETLPFLEWFKVT
ncbi:hypothetical protein E2C01_065514 [Portunus trituberculatus]|uniref:Uncharacterized protein n=1 Tax=Portunus trituberculatus TaxID=210409 RepID=A0A5B7HJ20_PORTR|nr:hypothetical protein [Portunus trituberculatus]